MIKQASGDPSELPAHEAKASQVRASRALSSRKATEPGRVDKLVGLVDHCTAAKLEADALGETFLAYLLAMTIQEGRAAIRRSGNR